MQPHVNLKIMMRFIWIIKHIGIRQRFGSEVQHGNNKNAKIETNNIFW